MSKMYPLKSVCCDKYPQHQKVNGRLLVVMGESTYEGETETFVLGASFDEEEAKKIFKENVKDIKENDHLTNKYGLVIEEDDESFAMYQDGLYSVDHISVEIKGTTMDVCDAVELKKIEFCEQMIAERIDRLGYYETINDLFEREWDRGDLLQCGFPEEKVDEVLAARIKKKMEGGK